MIHFNIDLSCAHASRNSSLPFEISRLFFLFLIPPTRAVCSDHLILLDLIIFKYEAKSKYDEAAHYVIFSNLLLFLFL